MSGRPGSGREALTVGPSTSGLRPTRLSIRALRAAALTIALTFGVFWMELALLLDERESSDGNPNRGPRN